MTGSPSQQAGRQWIPAALGLVLLLLIGGISGEWWMALALTGLALLAWQVFNLRRLQRWLDQFQGKPPRSLGMWNSLYRRLYQIQRDYRRRQSALKATVKEFRRATDAYPDATMLLNHRGEIVWMNKAAVELLGMDPATDEGQPITNLIRQPAFADWLALQGQISNQMDLPLPGDEDRTLSVTIIPYHRAQSLLVFREVTQLKRVDRIRRDFVANVSHELRTPLTVLMGYLETISMDGNEELEPILSKMLGQGQQMQRLIEDLLELSRLQDTKGAVDADEIDIPALMAQLKEQAETLSDGRHELAFHLLAPVNLQGVLSDIKSAFLNLIGNAIRYTPRGGRIEVRWLTEDGQPVFSVTDTGVGIARQHIPRLTERFYRVAEDRARSSGGTGLGLAIVKHVLGVHQAHLDISSEVGEGSTFRCVFPRQRAVPHPESTRKVG